MKNDTIKFALAGNFYKNIRNPRILFEYLSRCDFDFIFDIYTNINFQDNYDCLKGYKEKLKNKIFFKPFKKRRMYTNFK